MLNFLVFVYEKFLYPDRWNVEFVKIELEDGQVHSFQNPDYYGFMKSRIIVIPQDKDEQLSFMKNSIISTKTCFDR